LIFVKKVEKSQIFGILLVVVTVSGIAAVYSLNQSATTTPTLASLTGAEDQSLRRDPMPAPLKKPAPPK